MNARPQDILDPASREFYIDSLRVLNDTGARYLLGGAYAFARYTDIHRHTKDLDIFVREEDSATVLRALEDAGYHTELTYPHWLGKARRGDDFIDVIFSSGNGVGRIDDAWFEHAEPDEVFGVPVALCPAEEMIWHKAFVMERERFDGADVAHLLRARAQQLDWRRLIERFGPYGEVLLAHLFLFRFIYPAERDRVPESVLRELLDRFAGPQAGAVEGRVCRGTILSREQYLVDVTEWGYRDARVAEGAMSREEVGHWTDAINDSL